MCTSKVRASSAILTTCLTIVDRCTSVVNEELPRCAVVWSCQSLLTLVLYTWSVGYLRQLTDWTVDIEERMVGQAPPDEISLSLLERSPADTFIMQEYEIHVWNR